MLTTSSLSCSSDTWILRNHHADLVEGLRYICKSVFVADSPGELLQLCSDSFFETDQL